MKNLTMYAGMLVVVLALSACTPTGTGDPTAEATAPVVENTEVVATSIVEADAPTATVEIKPTEEEMAQAEIRYPLLGTVENIQVTEFEVSYTTDISLGDITKAYSDAMQSLNCNLVGETAGENDATAVLFVCMSEQGEVVDEVAMVFKDAYEGSSNVSIVLGYPEPIAVELPIPEDATDVVQTDSDASMHLGPDATDAYVFYSEFVAANNCLEGGHADGPGAISVGYYCLDDAGKGLFNFGLLIVFQDDGSEDVTVDVRPISYIVQFYSALPADASGMTINHEGALSFQTALSLSDAAALYQSGEASLTGDGECTMVAETGSPNGAVAMQFLCNAYYGPGSAFLFDYEVSVVIQEIESGSDVTLTINFK